MIKFFRKIRQNLLFENKSGLPSLAGKQVTGRFRKYLPYAIGEIVLVVIGILIAIQINDWNQERERNQEELDSYQLIIIDLKRDSILFEAYHKRSLAYLDAYFQMNDIHKGQGYFRNILPDYLVSNVEFNPVTQNNHQATNEKLRNSKIREQINNYFGCLNQVQQATKEFNEFITQESRPYFLKEQDIFDNKIVFDKKDKSFPPSKRLSTLDTLKLRKTITHPYFLPILSELRMSIGFYLATLEKTIEENDKLIQALEKNLN